MKKVMFLLQIVLLSSITFAQVKNVENNISNKKNYFIENKGQWNSDVLYLYRIDGLDTWITKYGLNYTFYKIERNEDLSCKNELMPRDKYDKYAHDVENKTLMAHRILFELQNFNPNPQKEGKQKQESYFNYFIGNDPSKHASYVSLYKEVLVKEVYPGIDMRYYFDRGFLRYDFIVHAGADPSQIKFSLKGQYEDYIKNNQVLFTTRFGDVAMTELHTYQGNKTIPSHFVKQGDVYTISLANYDRSQDLIIDPLFYSTYLGGSGEDGFRKIVTDGSGNAYVVGWTQSINYDITTGAFQTTYGGGNRDVVVTKLNNTGNVLLYSTYIGGSEEDMGYDIALDGSGNAYVTGYTKSADYDITTGAFQTTYGGGYCDIFVTKLNATGSGLVYSTYLGGSASDLGLSIAIDSSGNAYVTGYTQSTDYDITAGAFQSTHGGGNRETFVTKLNPTGSVLVYSTYLGGSMEDTGNGIAVDSSGNAYVTGSTKSTDYDITAGAFQTTYGGGSSEVFVTKLNATGGGLVYSTYLGGSGEDFGNSIAVDSSGNAYVTGYTESTDYDITAGAFQTTYVGGYYDVFVTKLNNMGSGLVYSTYLGGSSSDQSYDIAVDGSGNAYVTGHTNSTNYDTTAGAFQSTYGGGSNDVFVTKLNTTGSALLYSTYLGGSGVDLSFGIAVDGSGNAYVTGFTNSIDYDITANAFQTTYEWGGYDGFVTKLCLVSVMTINLSSPTGTDNQTVCINTPITNIIYTTSGATEATFSGLPAGVLGSFNNDTVTLSGIPTQSGTFNYAITLTDGCGNVTANGTIMVNSVDISITQKVDTLISNQANASYQWVNCPLYTPIVGQTDQSFLPVISGSYAVIIDLNGCIDTSDCQHIIISNIETNLNSYLISIYPDPAENNIFISVQDNILIENVKIYNQTGQLICQFEKPENNVLDISGLAQGLYFVRVESEEKFYLGKFVKQ